MPTITALPWVQRPGARSSVPKVQPYASPGWRRSEWSEQGATLGRHRTTAQSPKGAALKAMTGTCSLRVPSLAVQPSRPQGPLRGRKGGRDQGGSRPRMKGQRPDGQAWTTKHTKGDARLEGGQTAEITDGRFHFRVFRAFRGPGLPAGALPRLLSTSEARCLPCFLPSTEDTSTKIAKIRVTKISGPAGSAG